MLAGVDCCDPNGLDRVFTGRLVRRELRAFRRGGLNRRQQEIVALLGPLTPGSSVLDIGCGIGAIGTTLLTGGAGSGLFVDVSSAYLNAAREVGAEAGIEERAAFYRDDFATSARPYPEADVVVLDRVVCCYRTLRRCSRGQPTTASGRSSSATRGPFGSCPYSGRSALSG